MEIKTRPLSFALGAEIVDFSITSDLSVNTINRIKDAFKKYQILLFRHQAISFETHIAFSKLFGELDNHDSVPDYRHDIYPELIVVTNKGREPSKVFGRQWHSDHSMSLSPTTASLLHAHVLPDIGGETMFTNMYMAYDLLSKGMKEMLEHLNAVHTIATAHHLRGADPEMLAYKLNRNPPVVHPVVKTHPETGKKSLYVNEMMTSHFENMTAAESQPLLHYLFNFSTQPELIYRHKWEKHDLIIWDNRCTMHHALGDYDHEQVRLLYRTTVKGPVTGRYETS